MNCPYCESHSRTTKQLDGTLVEWCYGCGRMFKVVLVSGPMTAGDVASGEVPA